MTVKASKGELEEHLRNTCSHNQRHLPSTFSDDMPPLTSSLESTIDWQHLEITTMIGCTIFPLAFTMAMEIII